MRNGRWLGAVLALVACGQKEPDVQDVMRQEQALASQPRAARLPPDAAPAPRGRHLTFDWTPDHKKATDHDDPARALEVGYGDHGTYTVSFSGFPDGTLWKVGAQEGGCCGKSTFDVADLRPRLANVPLDDRAEVDPGAVLTLHTPGGDDATVPLPPVAVRPRTMLQIATTWPMRFGDEPDRTGPIRSIAEGDEIVGRARVLGDVDAVALAEQLSEVKYTRVCGGYHYQSNPAVAASADTDAYRVQFVETRVDIYDRRTATLLASKVFPPPRTCPALITPDLGTPQSDTPDAAIRAWLRAQVGTLGRSR